MVGLDVSNLPVGTVTLVSLLVLLPVAYYVFLAASFVRKMRNIGKVVDQLPGPQAHWLRGNLGEHPGYGEEGLAWLRNMTNQYRTCFRLWWGPVGTNVNCVHPDTIKPVLRSSEPKSLNGGYKMIQDWLGDGLLLSSGSKWFRNRRLLSPAFHFDVLKPYMKIYNEATNIFVDQVEQTSDEGSVEICRPVALLTLNVILRCAFSSDADVQRHESLPYVNAVLGMGTLFVRRLMQPWQYINSIYNMTQDGKLMQKYIDTVHSVSEDVVAKRKLALRENPDELKKRYLDFLDILLTARDEDGQGLTDREIRDEVDTFLFEGHDTTASAISWLLYDMARNPDNQQTCREEVEQFMGCRETKDVEWDDLSQLQFTTQCIKESIRLHSPVPIIGREVSKEFVIDGVTLKPGTFLDICIYLCNHNEHVWGSDHMEYKPERFDSDKVEAMDSFTYVPFSAGPRNCIGQNFAMHEIKVVLAKVLNRFVLEVDPTHEVRHKIEFVMRAEDGIKIFFRTRA